MVDPSSPGYGVALATRSLLHLRTSFATSSDLQEPPSWPDERLLWLKGPNDTYHKDRPCTSMLCPCGQIHMQLTSRSLRPSKRIVALSNDELSEIQAMNFRTIRPELSGIMQMNIFKYFR